jgi:hypothetical protein
MDLTDIGLGWQVLQWCGSEHGPVNFGLHKTLGIWAAAQLAATQQEFNCVEFDRERGGNVYRIIALYSSGKC